MFDKLIKEDTGKYNVYIRNLVKKNMCGLRGFSFRITNHFVERLVRDRSNQIHPSIIKMMLAKLFDDKLCLFLYTLTVMGDQDTIYLTYDDVVIVITKTVNNNGKVIVSFPTLYRGPIKSIYNGVAYMIEVE